MTDTSPKQPKFVGDFYDGAYGPTILLKALSPDAAFWLHGIFVQLGSGDVHAVDLASTPEVVIPNITEFRLYVADETPAVALKQASSDGGDWRFDWRQIPEAWDEAAGLLEPFVNGNSGHQYFSSAVRDDGLIEISFGEPDVGASLLDLLDLP